MDLRKGDRGITTDKHWGVDKGTKGVVVEPPGFLMDPLIAFENGKKARVPKNKLAKI